MAGESKEILELSKHLLPVFNELRNVARTLGAVSEKLSNTGLDKFTDHLKKSLKTNQLINDADMEYIKDAKSLEKTLAKLEDQYEAILKLDKEAARVAKHSLGEAKVSKKAEQEAFRAARATLESRYEEHDVTLDMIDAIKSGIPVIRKEAEARAKEIQRSDSLQKVHEGLTKSITSQIQSFATLGTGVALLKKAFFTSYEQMNRLSSRGMLGAFQTLQFIAPKLLISAQDLEDILNKNRDIINTMGGGVKGVEAFSEEISRVRGEVKYLGKEATKAAARFIEMSRKSGLTPKDGLLYRKNLDSSIKQFQQFSGLFGDSYEDYASLMEQIQDDENIRKRLNTLNKNSLGLELEEIRQRTANLKLMGLSNQQIIEFNKQLNNIVNPRKNDFSERAVQSIAFKQSSVEMARILQKSSSPEDQAILADLQANQKAIQHIADLNQKGNPKELADFMQSAQGAAAARAYSKAAAKTDMANQFSRGLRNSLMEKAGGLGQTVDQYGGALATAKTQGRDITGNQQQQAAIMKEADELVAAASKTAAALNAMTTAVEGVKALFENPLVNAIGGAIATLWALGRMKAIGGIVSGALGGLKGLTGGLASAARMLGTLPGAAGVAAAGGAGYLLGDKVVNPLLNKSAEALTGRKGETFGTGLYSGIEKLQGSGWLPGKTDAQKQKESEQAAWQSQYSKNLNTQGYVTKKQADLYKMNGVTVDASKVRDTGATGAPGSASNTPYDFNKFANNIAQRESGGNLGTVNTLGFVGKYQFGAAALQDLGLVKSGTTNRGLNDPSNWLSPGGLQGFLANGPLQEEAFRRYTDMHYQQLLKAGVITPTSPPDEVAGYLAAAHLKGIGGAIDLKNGKNGTDAYGTSTKSYFELGAATQGGSGVAPMTPATALASYTPRGSASTVSAQVSGGTTVAPVSSASPSSTPTAGSQGSAFAEATGELKKQTNLLAELVRNTTGGGRLTARADSYLQDSSVVMGGITG